MNATKRAIRYIEECRDIHVQWAARPNRDIPDAAGDRAWHRKWVRRYDHVLSVLRP